METRLLPSTHHILDINIFVGEGNNDTNMCMRVCVRMCVHTHSVMSDLSRLQAPLSIEFSMQEYWSGLPFPTRGHLPNPGIKPVSNPCLLHLLHWQADSIPLCQVGSLTISIAVMTKRKIEDIVDQFIVAVWG